MSETSASRRQILERLAAHSQGAPASQWLTGDHFAEPLTMSALNRFVELIEQEATTTERLEEGDSVPQAVARYLRRQELASSVVSTLSVGEGEWAAAGVECRPSPVATDGDVFVGPSVGAVAECGAFVLSSGSEQSLADVFLAQTHIIVLREQLIFPSLSALWVHMRELADGSVWPREFCMVTGPSRTADLGIPAKLGAHGPARVHVLIV